MSYTINPNAKNKWARNAENTMDLSIETDASSVYLDNGRTLEQELGEGSMISNVATVNTSMSKVIDGTLDGVYESGAIYGRSLVNLSNLHKSFNDATLGDYYVDTSLCETSKLKLGTPYTLVFYTAVHGGDHDIYNTIELGVSNSLHATNAHPNTTTSYDGTLVKNGWSKKCVTFTDFRGYKYLSLRPIRCNAPVSGKSIHFSIEGFILLEGDWSNKDLPFNDYFTGLCDVKMPILRNVGKNLFDKTLPYELFYGNSGYNSYEIKLKPNTSYSIITEQKINVTQPLADSYVLFSKKKCSTSSVEFWLYHKLVHTANGYITTTHRIIQTNDEGCLYLTFGYTSESDLKIIIDSLNIQIAESSTATTYEPYKTNILRTSEEIVLREVNGVQDTYNPLTGEYVQRIGEIVLDGSEEWVITISNNQHTNVYSAWTMQPIHNAKLAISDTERRLVICDKMKFDNKALSSCDFEFCFISSTGKFNMNINRSKLSEMSANALKTYLQQNPITVQYELAEPITTIVEPLTIPFAYENGHIILESGSEEQSLLPTLEYSTVVNRTGQVEGVAKVIQKQEKQLTMLEQMLIQNIINLDYNNTLLTLKNEMEEML